MYASRVVFSLPEVVAEFEFSHYPARLGVRTRHSVWWVHKTSPVRETNAAPVACLDHILAYNESVARGWESKSIESQQDDARSAAEPKHHLSTQERGLQSRKEALQLARSRTLQQIHSTENPRYRNILEQALKDLEQQLARLC